MQESESICLANYRLNIWQEQIILDCLLLDLIEVSEVDQAVKTIKKFVCIDELYKKYCDDPNNINKALAFVSQLY